MKPSEKYKSDVLRSMSELRGEAPSSSFARAFTARHFAGLPAEAQAALALSFEGRCAADPEKAGDWAAAVGSIFLEDYDGTELAAEDWRELRDILSESSGELDIGLLSYAMGLILEHKAL
jgi:hypothetical protein